MIEGRTAFRGTEQLAWLIISLRSFNRTPIMSSRYSLDGLDLGLHAIVAELASKSMGFSSPFGSAMSVS